ncbi:MAG TPA: YjgN family protein [Usitatibacter sp.]
MLPEADNAPPEAPQPDLTAAAVSLSMPSPAVEAALGNRSYPFSFTGDAKEYFRIWIVNLFLSVITLGLYSPWAKVRKNRYLYANTWVADANFEYHANPVAILKGRLIAVAALIAYNLGGHYLPKLGTAIVVLLMVAAPWLVVRSMQFNAVNTSYRNLRFHFHGRYGEGLKVIAPFLLSPILALLLPTFDPTNMKPNAANIAALFLPILPLSFFYPWVMAMLKRFQVGNLAYGSQHFAITLKISSFYGIYLLAGALTFVAALVMGVAIAILAFISQALATAVPVLTYFFLIAVVFAFTRSRVTNLTFNASSAGRARFVSSIGFWRLARIYFVNVFVIVVTCGLMVPWAVVRVAKYRAECLRLEADGDLEGVLADVSKPVAATGDQLGEFFDVDLSL